MERERVHPGNWATMLEDLLQLLSSKSKPKNFPSHHTRVRLGSGKTGDRDLRLKEGAGKSQITQSLEIRYLKGFNGDISWPY